MQGPVIEYEFGCFCVRLYVTIFGWMDGSRLIDSNLFVVSEAQKLSSHTELAAFVLSCARKHIMKMEMKMKRTVAFLMCVTSLRFCDNF